MAAGGKGVRAAPGRRSGWAGRDETTVEGFQERGFFSLPAGVDAGGEVLLDHGENRCGSLQCPVVVPAKTGIHLLNVPLGAAYGRWEIGRASCRERVCQ